MTYAATDCFALEKLRTSITKNFSDIIGEIYSSGGSADATFKIEGGDCVVFNPTEQDRSYSCEWIVSKDYDEAKTAFDQLVSSNLSCAKPPKSIEQRSIKIDPSGHKKETVYIRDDGNMISVEYRFRKRWWVITFDYEREWK